MTNGKKNPHELPLVGEPPVFDGEKITSLTFRKAKARDLLAADAVKGQLRKSMALFASICDVPLTVIEDLDIEDFEAVGTKAPDYLGKRGREALAEAAAKAEQELREATE